MKSGKRFPMAYGILYDFLMGQSIEAYRYFGAHFETHDVLERKNGRYYKKSISGVMFRLYAPLASDVSIIGDWNGWDVRIHKMNKVDEAGVFELFIPGLTNYECYKYHFKNAKGLYVDKADPFAFFSELRPSTCSRLFDIEGFSWNDRSYQAKKASSFEKPMSIYEIHLGSWLGKKDGRYLSYEELADRLIPYLKETGFTDVEIMPITQYPFDGSWGYQSTGFFSVDSRYGNPFQLMSFVDRLHQNGFGVILDFAPVHFANDSFALREFDGSCLYEYSDPKHTFSPWGSCLFDLGKDPVRSFLMSAMNYFVTYFHFDGIRVDAVSNIVYWDGNKAKGENTGATEFIKRLNGKLHYAHPNLMMIAEDSTDFQGVTKKTEEGGLGFDYKWDLGWMNDTLKYYSKDPIYKKWEHNKITFSMAYFWSEKFLLPLSHDEVVHGKGTLINKMYGDYDTKFDLLRNLFVYQFAHPGKKLNFMGNELASFDEWNENRSLPWNLLTFPKHDSVKRLIHDLNLLYQKEEALYKEEYSESAFHWTMVDNASQSVFAFQRRAGESDLLFVFNMTPNYYETFDVGVMDEGCYRELLNSDKDIYGGRNQYCGGDRFTSPNGPEGRPYKLTLKIGGYSALIMKRIVNNEPMKALETKEKDVHKEMSTKNKIVSKAKAKRLHLKGVKQKVKKE